MRRPAIGVREVLEEGDLDLAIGLTGDNWSVKASTATPDGSPDPAGQITLMNARTAGVIAGQPERWALAGDQLYVDLDLSDANLPAGTRLAVGDAVIEITAKPHLGCAKFAARFGRDALRFVNTGPGRRLNLRGRNARVVVPGTIRRGDSSGRWPAPPMLRPPRPAPVVPRPTRPIDSWSRARPSNRRHPAARSGTGPHPSASSGPSAPSRPGQANPGRGGRPDRP